MAVAFSWRELLLAIRVDKICFLLYTHKAVSDKKTIATVKVNTETGAMMTTSLWAPSGKCGSNLI